VRDLFEKSPEFRRLLSGDETADLVQIGWEMARDDQPDLDATRYERVLDRLAERVRERCPSGAKVRHILGQINWVLFVEERFRGNTDDYRDPRNSALNQVIDRKLGIPISLSIVYRAVARRIGLELEGVNLPAHFMLRTAGSNDDAIFIDAFQQGTLLDLDGCKRAIESMVGQPIDWRAEHFAPCSISTIVTRILLNLKSIHLGQGDFADVIPVLQRLVALHPDDPDHLRDLGMAALATDRPGLAVDPLQRYLAIRPRADDSPTILDLLRQARRDLSSRN
jgi:regulator of sirC expression with transglutaminase-like and TPR domain